MIQSLMFFFIVFTATLAAAMPPRGGGLTNVPMCPSGSPSPDGSQIVPVAGGQTSCTLTDRQNNKWQFQGTHLFVGSSDIGPFPLLVINQGHAAFTQFTCAPNHPPLWMVYYFEYTPYSWFPGGYDPILPYVTPTRNVTLGLDAGNLYDLLTANGIADGQTIQVNALPSGGYPFVWYMGSRYGKNNLTINLQPGAGVGCMTDESNAILVNNGGNGTTITGGGSMPAAQGGSEIAWAHDTQSAQFRCLNLGNDNAWTLQHLYIHDCDFGVQATTTPSGTATMTDVVLDHNGGGGPASTSTTHNVYLGWIDGLSSDLSRITASNVRSYCTNGTTAGAGFEFKTRWPGGTFQNVVFAEPSQHGYTDCNESAAMDMSCGGNYTIGGAGTGQGAVLEVGSGLTLGSADGLIRYGRENSGGCPLGGWPTSSLLIQNCWLINDSSKTTLVAVAHGTFAGGVPSMTVKNCKLVGLAGLGADVINGGGNTFFATRSAAGLPPYPALPSPP